jgi:uncharacterized protein (DUF1697 family)
LKVDVPVVVKTAAQIAAIVAGNPIALESDSHARLLVVYAQQRAALERLASLEPLIARGERFAIGREAAYLFCAAGILQSKAGEALLGRAGREVTTRNWATTLKLHALTGAGSR